GYGRASPRSARHPGAAVPPADEVACGRRSEAGHARGGGDRRRRGSRDGVADGVSAALPLPRSAAPLDDILARLAVLHPKRIDLTLERMWRILDRLDHPERRLPPVIHVAGTNGKGSTFAYLRAILEAAGLRVHVFTSPYLVRINECMRLAGTLVADDALRGALLDCERANGG